jgi:hypothetical protein
VKTLRIALTIPGAFLVAAIVMRALAVHAPTTVTFELVQPLAVLTNANAYGAASLGTLTVALVVATMAYLRIVAPSSGTSAARLGSPAAVAGIAIFALACAWCVPAIFSSDVYAYAAYGELARLGGDPYAHALLPRGDPLFDAAIVQWGNPPPACVYGSVFVWIAAAIVRLGESFGTVVQLAGFRALSSAALAACGLLAYRAYPGDRAARLTAAGTIALNPVAIWCAAEGHNDALAVAVVLAGFGLARRGLFAVGAAVAAFSGSIKLPGLAAALPLALGGGRAAAGAAVGALATLAMSVPLFESLAAGIAPHGRYAPQASFQAIVKPLVGLALSGDRTVAAVTWVVAAAAAAACALAGVARLRRARVEGWTYLALAGWLLVPNPYPWYALWLVAVAAIAPGTRGATVLLWLSLAALARYVPDAVGVPATAASIALGVIATLPFLALLRPREPGLL